MREELLHYVWKFTKFQLNGLQTAKKQVLQLLDVGTQNKHSGPDFLNARIEIDKQLWAGNIEIHVKSSDWYAHKHSMDRSYDNVILHVVWELDKPVFRPTGEEIPTLVLRNYVAESLLDSYVRLMSETNRKFINCEDCASEFSVFLLLPWLEHIFRERLEQKSRELDDILSASANDWEKLLFIALLKNFGQRANRTSFLSLAKAIDFNIVKRIKNNAVRLESLLFGLSGLLEKYPETDPYHSLLASEYNYLKKKHKLNELQVEMPEFMGVRPLNFPTIRLSQFAALYSNHQNLFSRLIALKKPDEFYEFFSIQSSGYWKTHYNFGKTSKEKSGGLSRAFKDMLIINCVVPLKFLYARDRGEDIYQELRNLISQLSKENNNVVYHYQSLGFPARHALDSQALLHLHDSYCRKNRCLECALGNQILK
ncbi:MAG: DUF2851 family protein [Flavobacteriaceae bacterium]